MNLTERAKDPSDYPGQIVFPRAVGEPGDGGPIASALRDTEKVGLDIDHVHAIGCLPMVALPDTGFLVHPVLAWSERATSDGSVSLAEVAACLEIPLCQFADRHRHTPPAGDDERRPAEPQQLGTVTSAVIDMLLARLPSGEHSRGSAQVNNHPMAVGANPPAPWEKPSI